MTYPPRAHNARERFVLRLKPEPAAIAAVRAWVHDNCLKLKAPSRCDDTVLIASELVTNGVRHARTELLVELHGVGSGIYIAVTDGSSDPVRSRQADLVDEGGRGLLLVAALAKQWGVSALPNGKRVWAELC